MIVTAAVIVGGAIWALFSFVVTDERLFLDYVRALVWPLLLGVMLYWLRAPLREKFGQLLRLEGFGASAQFSPEIQGMRLQAELDEDLTELFGDGDGSDEQATDEPETAVAIPTEHLPVAVNQPTPSASLPVVELGPLIESLGLDGDAHADTLGALSDPDRRHAALLALTHRAEKGAAARKRQASRSQQSRESIESVVRKSASWGYEMGKAGAPEAVPDIEWGDDGGWRITTEVPLPRRTPSRPSHDSGAERVRQIRTLENEIKELEKKKYSLSASVTSQLVDAPWLSELKRRLQRLDPGNPWGME
jgi:hypothetical protein